MRLARFLPILLLGGCAVVPPSGPTVLAMPPQGGDLQRFQAQDLNCRNYAAARTGYGGPAQAATNAAVGSAAIGTAVGAAAGALVGSATGQAGAGAAIGAGAGLAAGSIAGANTAAVSSAGLQANYDVAYAQCMTAAGNSVQGPPVPVAVPYAAPVYPYPYAYPYVAPVPVPAPYYWGPRYPYGAWRGYGYWGRPYGYRW
jgi:hypothetical protein